MLQTLQTWWAMWWWWTQSPPLQTHQAHLVMALIEVVCALLLAVGTSLLARQEPERPLARMVWRLLLGVFTVIGGMSLLLGSLGLYFTL